MSLHLALPVILRAAGPALFVLLGVATLALSGRRPTGYCHAMR